MILYINKNLEKSHVKTTNDTSDIKSVNIYLNNLATNNLLDIKGYKQSVRKTLNLKSNIPIRFNEHILLFKIKTYNKGDFYINYYGLLEVICNKEDILLVFKNSSNIILSTSKNSLKNQLNKCIQINNHLKTVITNSF